MLSSDPIPRLRTAATALKSSRLNVSPRLTTLFRTIASKGLDLLTLVPNI